MYWKGERAGLQTFSCLLVILGIIERVGKITRENWFQGQREESTYCRRAGLTQIREAHHKVFKAGFSYSEIQFSFFSRINCEKIQMLLH